MDTEFLRPTVPILQGPRERIFLTNRFKYKSHLRVGIRGIEESEIRSLRRVSFCVVRKNQRSKEFSRHDDSIPYLDNTKLILFLTTQNETRLSKYATMKKCEKYKKRFSYFLFELPKI